MPSGQAQHHVAAWGGAARTQFPGFVSRRLGEAEAHHNAVPLSWELTSPDERLHSVTGFLNPVPGGVTAAPLLRRTLLADAVVSGAFGLALVGSAPFLLGLPTELLRAAGSLLLPSRRVGVMAVNTPWLAESLRLLAPGRVNPTFLGRARVMAGAILVALFTAVQAAGLWRANRPPLA
ncbi:hypothetical protein [Deinococcus hopiensis]|uniref:Uncharacterized protein n=1 Tax=Deinococcus hopiensis KR-140 TaxID=695939 RepID=A0A1W1VEU4_9DEIO|nr:hypothetical protein [Deinococcus hopiensis]SMB91581.1 hypothetical protein SAMN00790413_01200 [Deinococcus hopiensis KR-140]